MKDVRWLESSLNNSSNTSKEILCSSWLILVYWELRKSTLLVHISLHFCILKLSWSSLSPRRELKSFRILFNKVSQGDPSNIRVPSKLNFKEEKMLRIKRKRKKRMLKEPKREDKKEENALKNRRELTRFKTALSLTFSQLQSRETFH